jgi:hypothetical protein
VALHIVRPRGTSDELVVLGPAARALSDAARGARAAGRSPSGESLGVLREEEAEVLEYAPTASRTIVDDAEFRERVASELDALRKESETSWTTHHEGGTRREALSTPQPGRYEAAPSTFGSRHSRASRIPKGPLVSSFVAPMVCQPADYIARRMLMALRQRCV